jgi:hypothetical protein
MKKVKVSRGGFPKGHSKIMPRMNSAEKKTKFMSAALRKAIYKSQDHYGKTKDLPTI